MPREATAILQRLTEVEARLQEKADLEVAAKRQAVAKILEQHSVRETRSGNIEAAVELQRLAKEFQAASSAKSSRQLGFVPDSGSMRIKIQIDGLSWLLIGKTHLWLSHEGGLDKPAGRHLGEFPTTIDGEEWMPVWQGRITKRRQLKVPIPVDSEDFKLKARLRSGRGKVEVEEQPSSENGYVAKIRMADVNENGEYFGSSDWMEFRLTW